jgi:hypothetical protein
LWGSGIGTVCFILPGGDVCKKKSDDYRLGLLLVVAAVPPPLLWWGPLSSIQELGTTNNYLVCGEDI